MILIWVRVLLLLASEAAKQLISDAEDVGEDHIITKTIDAQHVALGSPRELSVIHGVLRA